MPILVVCSHCGRSARFADNDAGLAVSCLGCRKTLRVQAPVKQPKPMPVIEEPAPWVKPVARASAGQAVAAPAPGARPHRAGSNGQAAAPAGGKVVVVKPESRPPAAPTAVAKPTGAPTTEDEGPKLARLATTGMVLIAVFAAGMIGLKVYSYLTGPAESPQAAATGPATSGPTTAPAAGSTPNAAAVAPVPVAPVPVAPAPAAVPLPLGIVGLDAIELHGTVKVDAYDSATGEYDDAKAADTALVASNGPVRLFGEGAIKGSVRPGPDAPLKLSKKTKVTGSTASIERALVAEPVDVTALAAGATRAAELPDGVLSNGNLTLAGKRTVAIPAGVYDVRDLTIDTRATLRCDGPVTLLVRGRVTVMGAIEAHQNRPKNLVIQVAGTGPVVLATRADVYADVYAPQSSLDVSGRGDFFGRLTARTVKVSGRWGFHVDQSLGK